MANYYTQASFMLELTPQQAEFGLAVCAYIAESNVFGLEISDAVVTVSKNIMDAVSDIEFGYGLDFNCLLERDGLWIHADESIDLDHAATFCHILMQHFQLETCLCIDAAHTCSSPRLDAFGGTSVFVTRHEIKWNSTSQWLSDLAVAHNKNREVSA